MIVEWSESYKPNFFLKSGSDSKYVKNVNLYFSRAREFLLRCFVGNEPLLKIVIARRVVFYKR